MTEVYPNHFISLIQCCFFFCREKKYSTFYTDFEAFEYPTLKHAISFVNSCPAKAIIYLVVNKSPTFAKDQVVSIVEVN